MKRNYCTLFDKNYLYQGVALYQSLVRHAGNFQLYVLCMDQVSFSMLRKMNLANITPVAVEDLITPELKEVRLRTSHGQFCWVCQPFICRYILDQFQVDMVTYLEADSLFFSCPETLFDELGTRSVSIVPHNYSSEFDNSASAGKFCVQFNAFRNDVHAREVLAYWIECCLRYDKSLPRTYPGQKSLDDWPNRFKCVAVIEHRGAGVAPWNIRGYQLALRGTAKNVNGFPVVFFHYHQYGRLVDGNHELGSYPMSRDVIDAFYLPYVNELRKATLSVQQFDPTFNYRREYANTGNLKYLIHSFSKEAVAEYLGTLKRKFRGRYNVYPDEYFPIAIGNTGVK